jgi:hypothetical protein
MTLADLVVFGQEWGALIALFLLLLLAMAADLFPRVAAFIAEIEAVFPSLYDHLEAKEQALVNRYDRLPARIRAGCLGGWENSMGRTGQVDVQVRA